MEFADRAEAMVWIMTNQFARRNLNDAQRGYLIGKRFNAEAPGQGARTDLGSGQSGVAERLGREFQMSDRAVRDCGRFADAVDILTNALGVEVRQAILGKGFAVLARGDPEHRPSPRPRAGQVWQAALKDRSSLKRVMAREKRREQKRDHADAVKLPGSGKASAAERYDLADLVRLIATIWPEDRGLRSDLPAAGCARGRHGGRAPVLDPAG
jgi:hypothetical protein